MGQVRWVHVCTDGSETDYAEPPADIPTIQVTLVGVTKRCAKETALTYNREGRLPIRPPGLGWELGHKGYRSSRWRRRRLLRRGEAS